MRSAGRRLERRRSSLKDRGSPDSFPPAAGGVGLAAVVPRLDPTSLGQHLDALYRAAWALCGSREDAEDLVQETFTRVLARPRTVKGGGDRAYLMSALRNTFYSRLRTASRRPRVTETLDEMRVAESRVSSQPERAVEVSEIFAAIAELPEDFRLAIVAVDVLGLSYGEAAQALDAREATITTRLYRARQRVARRLGDDPSPSREGTGPDRSLTR
jgi:RNA polymerase sigma-70 factor (ECF subfamily)